MLVSILVKLIRSTKIVTNSSAVALQETVKNSGGLIASSNKVFCHSIANKTSWMLVGGVFIVEVVYLSY